MYQGIQDYIDNYEKVYIKHHTYNTIHDIKLGHLSYLFVPHTQSHNYHKKLHTIPQMLSAI